MGLFDFLRKRRERESAIPGGGSAGDVGDAGRPQSAGVDLTQIDTSSLGGFAKLFEAALKSGGANVSVTQAPAQVMDLQGQGEELRNAILETLRRNGIDAEKGQEVQVTDPGLQQEIFRTLAEHGVDIGAVAGAVAADPAVPMGSEDTVAKLERLQRLREQGALTEAEFEQQKRRILGD
jgi:Short C-terminal domain